jgi:hypothetical protein
MTPSDVIRLIKEKQVKFADLRFTDTRGKEQHVTIPARLVDEDFFRDGKMFDGSSIAGWKGINESDMILMPEANTTVIDPFFEETTVDIRCDVIEPATMQGYERDPRSLAKRAEGYLKSTGIADSALFGPENGVRSSCQRRGYLFRRWSAVLLRGPSMRARVVMPPSLRSTTIPCVLWILCGPTKAVNAGDCGRRLGVHGRTSPLDSGTAPVGR